MHRENKYEIFKLPNGLRCVWCSATGEVSYIGVAINVGSRDEGDSQYGLAHFVEHTLFKGTPRRKAHHISCRMEAIGGELNAYTSKEETMVYTMAPNGHSERAIELISDIVFNSIFPTGELDKEREVVNEEIYSYRDSPMDAVYDDFEEHIYAGSGLAHNILGSVESVSRLNGAECRKFLDDYYTPDNMVVYIVDSGNALRARRLVEKYFGGVERRCGGHRRIAPGIGERFEEIANRNNHQANTVLGTRLFGRNDSRRHALFLMNNYFGGPGMNSRLNKELRERRGWVYTADSTVSLMSDTGIIQIYYGCDPDKVEKCYRIIQREMEQLAEKRMSDKQLEAVKKQYCGQLILTTENKESRAMAMAKSIMYFGEIHNIRDAIENVRAVSGEEVRAVAELICERGLSRYTIE